MARQMLFADVLLAALCLLQGAAAQLQLCDPKLRVGGIPAPIIMKGTQQTGSTSEITVGWKRPADGPTGGLNSCISEYVVDVYIVGGGKVQGGTVKSNAAHVDASYTAKNLVPGKSYQFYVYGRNPTLGASGNGAGLRSAAFKAAGGAPACRQPQSVINIRREAAINQGSTATMTVAWNPPQTTPAECIKEYVVDIYPAGKKTIADRIKSVTVPAPNTKYTDKFYEAGKSYEFYIFARNPPAGASGNGIGIRSAPIMAPVGVTTGH